MKELTTKDLIVPIIRKVAAEITPLVNSKATDDDYYHSFMYITKYIKTLQLNVDVTTIIEATIRMVFLTKFSGYGNAYSVNDIEGCLLQNSTIATSGKGLAN